MKHRVYTSHWRSNWDLWVDICLRLFNYCWPTIMVLPHYLCGLQIAITNDHAVNITTRSNIYLISSWRDVPWQLCLPLTYILVQVNILPYRCVVNKILWFIVFCLHSALRHPVIYKQRGVLTYGVLSSRFMCKLGGLTSWMSQKNGTTECLWLLAATWGC